MCIKEKTIKAASLFKNKVIIIYGARQVGKTTLVNEIQKNYPDHSLYLNCDEPDIKKALTDKTSTQLKAYFGNSRLVIIDEAQRVTNIGLTLKLIADTFPDIQVIATGSSSFDLANKIVEPLTGRKREFFLQPISVAECLSCSSGIEFKRILENRMLFGMYPGVIFGDSREENKNIKWSEQSSSLPKAFSDNYPNATYTTVTKDTFLVLLVDSVTIITN